MTDLERAHHEAVQLFNQYYTILFCSDTDKGEECTVSLLAIQCAINDVKNTLNANPHSNPFNTEGSSTYTFFLMVKAELEKM
jgi:hypothetical protein